MVKNLRLILIGCLCVLTLTGQPVAAKEKPLVVFACPGTRDDAFFALMCDFMQAAADDLGFELFIYYGDRHTRINHENVKMIFNRKRLPEFVIGSNSCDSGKLMLDKAEAAGIKVMIINQGFIGAEQKAVGQPGEKYTQWLFEFLPDDVQSGYILARTLIEKALQNKLVDSHGGVQVLAISGFEGATVSSLRLQGLRQALREYPNVRLHLIRYADWERDISRRVVKEHLAEFPEVTVVWTESDYMAMGIVEGVREMGMIPGKDVVIGGVDWASLAAGMIENGDYTVSVGGHFLDGAWALVMLHDALHGVSVPRLSQSHFSFITADNVAPFRRYILNGNWELIDFRKFSKHLNPEITEYDFSLNAILEQLQAR
ncbi:ABC transporter substrate-binding protein [Pseudodesulfovibrio sediminis]|nr:ABC transporter substrate-binding protein [Pseudodesulfovibrio sediminis]